MPAIPYEKLGAFYLGREVDARTGADKPDLLLYDSRDLTTHAVCVGMTGSGKTGLCLSLLEEAAIDGVPAIAIDPKGDLGNLLLTFPQLRPEDFAQWVDAGEAARKGMTPDAYGANVAETWRKGLAEWDQDGARIQRLRDSAELAIYTPGSDAGRPISVLRSFAAPPPQMLADAGALRERVAATVGGLLGLVGLDADPIKSREHILLSTVFNAGWSQGRDLDLAAIIQAVQKPPFDKVGVLDLEAFYPAKERMELAMALNNLIASPGFAAWLHGEPLDVQRLLYDERGKPRIAVISIAHLSDPERMFVVTLLMGEVVAWMRRQSGASSLRALLYMDEIFGYFPPTASPPAKTPLLTLLKQGRAFGLGVVLATQNPVDLDYKGLSNAGTWFIGRLQTQRDQARVIEGLLGAAGDGLDKQEIENLLANLSARVFLMRNVHEDAPVLFRTRWALSYLRGPMTLQEIGKLVDRPPSSSSPPSDRGKVMQGEGTKPVIPAGIPELYLAKGAAQETLVPRVLGVARVHFVDKAAGVDAWETRSWLAPLDARDFPDWKQADVSGDLTAQLSSQPPAGVSYADAPAALLRPASYTAWTRDLAAHIYESESLTVLSCPQAGSLVEPATDEGEFRAQLAFVLRERRDAEVEKLRKRYAPRVATLEDQLRRADERIARERSQLSQQKMQTAISVGTSILGALLGRKKISVTNAGRIGSAARNAGRIGRESEDVSRAEESRTVTEQRLQDLQNELEQELAKIRADFDPATVDVHRIAVKPRKADIDVETMALLWTPAKEAISS